MKQYFYGLDQNKAELYVMESKSGVDFKVDPGSCCLGNYKIKSMWNVMLRNPLSEALALYLG